MTSQNDEMVAIRTQDEADTRVRLLWTLCMLRKPVSEQLLSSPVVLLCRKRKCSQSAVHCLTFQTAS